MYYKIIIEELDEDKNIKFTSQVMLSKEMVDTTEDVNLLKLTADKLIFEFQNYRNNTENLP